MAVAFQNLRRWFAFGLVLVLLLLGGLYMRARHHVENALKHVPGKLGLEIQQSANGFTISKSVQGRTLFTVHAGKAVQFKGGGKTELHGVEIVAYEKDSSRIDRIKGDDFEYDPKSGDITARGPVHIDVGEPASADGGKGSAESRTLHLEASGLVFNQNSGNAQTGEKVSFETPAFSGSTQGLRYQSHEEILLLPSDVNFTSKKDGRIQLHAESGTILRQANDVELLTVRLHSDKGDASAQHANIHLRSDDTIERVTGEGEVHMTSPTEDVKAARIDILMSEDGSEVLSSTLTAVQADQTSGLARRSVVCDKALVEFRAGNNPRWIKAQGNVKLANVSAPVTDRQNMSHTASNYEIEAPVVEAQLSNDSALQTVDAVEGSNVRIASSRGPHKNDVTASGGWVQAKFDSESQPTLVEVKRGVTMTERQTGLPDRTSSSDSAVIKFDHGDLSSVAQSGSFHYREGDREAFSQSAHYDAATGAMDLIGSPKIADRGMETEAETIVLNKLTGNGQARGNVKSSVRNSRVRNSKQADAGSSSHDIPIHVTAQEMDYDKASGVATYSGGVRLWRDDNVIEASSLDINQDTNIVQAHGTAGVAATARLWQVDKSGKAEPILIHSKELDYDDKKGTVLFNGSVSLKSKDAGVTCDSMEAYRSLANSGEQPSAAAPSVEKIIASGNVVVTQPDRHATGDRLVYTASDGKFVMTGGPPSIFDAEHGKITGVSLTLYSRDDRVLVKGDPTNPSVSEARVAR